MVSGYQVYQQNQHSSLSKGKLLIAVFDGMIRFLNQGISAIEGRDIITAHNKIIRVQEILGELQACIDPVNLEMAANLEMIYEYCYSQLIEANLKKDKEILVEVKSLITELGDGFKQAQGV